MRVYYYKTVEAGFHQVLKVDLAEYKHRLIVPGQGVLAYGDDCEFLILINDEVSLDLARQMIESQTYHDMYEMDDDAIESIVERARALIDATEEVARLGIDRAGLEDEMLVKRKSAARDAYLQLAHMTQIASSP